ncbi:MAG: hypothetical protein JO266_11760 [Acidobacteria bacterium]|nr:hypothetical protein [Acidobacteriota bacterium]MBV8892626.1 hypothetical protein [Acidobacteriota bacterium]MBV9479556.1 hypothetical protein [Acidobacteriota bacterium]
MARRSLLTPAREERPAVAESEPAVAEEARPQRGQGTKPSRVAKLHIGGYFDPADPTLIAFQKLRVDLRRSQQDMLLEALRDFVAKYQAETAFGR